MAPLGEAFGEAAADLSGRSCDEDFHLQYVAMAALRGLEESDIGVPKVALPRSPAHNRAMYASAVPRLARVSTSASRASGPSAVAALFVDERDSDQQGIAIPRPEAHLVVRFGPTLQQGLDVHALCGRKRVQRKLLRSGQRFVTARLHLGTTQAVLGVPASAVAGRIVPLEDLWGGPVTRRLFDRLADARDTFEAAAILDSAIAERFKLAGAERARAGLVLAAADRLTSESVNAVALELGVSERHLRRVFGESIGLSPKTFAKLTRFRRAIQAAREEGQANWATIAAFAGYYDQAHLITEFRAISGVTPRALLNELRVAHSIG